MTVELPFRAELFNADQMERHGKSLAKSHILAKKFSPDVLLSRLKDNEITLIKICETLVNTATEKSRIAPAGEWLLDNFYLIEEHIRITQHHLPKKYGKSLPQLASGLSRGRPRVYDIALQIIAHGDGHWDLESLNRFISAYQQFTSLTLGELWAIPIMLRLALIENLRRVGVHIAADQHNHRIANLWADRMAEVAELNPKDLILIIADMARSDPPMQGAFVSELVRCLQGRGTALTLPITWIEQQLAENGLTIEQVVQTENQQQAANQVSVSNSIASLRRLAEIDWRTFVENLSVIEQTLRNDPTDTYRNMDFTTRDRYRHVVEHLARNSLFSEKDVSVAAIALATSTATHVGFYVIGAGLPQLEKAVGARHSLMEKLRRGFSHHVLFYYLGFITLITFIFTLLLLIKANQIPMVFIGRIVFGIAAIIATSQFAVAIINWCATQLVKPNPLPKMDFTKGIPAAYRTLVVVPTMLGHDPAAVESLVEALEVRFLGNRDDSLHFALLTDFNDASQEHCDDDALLLKVAREQIELLNQRYPRENGDTFFLFHRPRRWNPGEELWMGYERKRGKLAELNKLLREKKKTNFSLFSLIVGNTEILTQIKYVITLDTDTQLPRESAQECIGAMAHPLNRPRYDKTLKRVVEGYGILQPRIAEALPTRGPTRYAKLCGGDFCIDPYTRTVSNVYQDLFDEGSFIGKGIYDVDIFQQVLEQRFPENHILSHDLIEGCYLRSGLLSDVPLYEQFPGSYLADASRRIRWIRGDWQLTGWLFLARLSALSRWKLFDNLRRSLVPLALLVLLGLGWIGTVLGIILLPTLLSSVVELFQKPTTMRLRQHLTVTLRSLGWRADQLALYITCLPHEAWYSFCAITRTLWRMLISHHHLLEWMPSDQANHKFHGTVLEWLRALWSEPVIAIVMGVLLAYSHPASLPYISPLLILWLTSPLITRWLSQPVSQAKPKLTPAQLALLNTTAQKIWNFFETFVTAEDNWLPPDNYQEAPVEMIAHRTSPTNIGLALLANLTAYDFGYITREILLERTANTFNTMAMLERYHGHFYNWYDTQTLRPLSPRYISTVDSGNLAGHLLTLRQGLLELNTEESERLAALAFDFAQMDVDFLYDHVSHLMTIGYNVDEQRSDRSSYDLLSSEARLGSFVAIAQGQVPQESWFALGRLLTLSQKIPILVSWGGSMFEYLMPLLIMPSYDGTLLDQTCHAAVDRQIDYGKERGVPWGISESGLHAVDAHLNYQYRAFGVPGLGLKRSLAEDLVIAPYATLMALMINPEAACENLQRLKQKGAEGKFGFYEAIDFTPSRVPRGKTYAIVRSFMAHHQSMSFLALSYLLNDQPMQKRFVADPLFQATLLLLQERIPKPVISYSHITHAFDSGASSVQAETLLRTFDTPNTPTPEIQLLSNGRYHVMLSQAGGGYSRWKELALTRWREDGTCDNWGLFGYLSDIKTGNFWSIHYQPTRSRSDYFKAVFSEGHVEFSQSNNDIDVHTEIVVSPEDDLELRRCRFHNRAKISRTLEFTSYSEIVLAPQSADQDHPAFSNLFVETEILSAQHAILATRRPLSEQEHPPWMFHLMNIHSDELYSISFETDRVNFIGRGHTPTKPDAMTKSGNLSNTAGAVLDPIMAIRCRITLEPNASLTLDLVMGITETREQSLSLIEKYRDRRLANRVFGLSWTHAQVMLRQLNISEDDAQLYSKLAGAIIYANRYYRAEPTIISSNKRGQSGLWGYAISGDLPILLVHIENADNIDLIRQLIHAHTYWRQKGLAVDLVILNEESASYRQNLQDQVMGLLIPGITLNVTDRAGGIFLRTTEQMPPEDRILLQSVARVILSDKNGSFLEQVDLTLPKLRTPPRLITTAKPKNIFASLPPKKTSSDLLFYNSFGGFTPDGSEYVIRAETPAPWINVLANPNFGTVISESGQAYTWTENAHEFRLTPWDNDPVQDTAGELFYLRDEETGQFWSPTPLPRRGKGDYETRHGFGYSVFEHTEDGIHSELWVYVAIDAPVKFSVLKIRNDSQQSRRLSAIGYVEWVLGDLRSKNTMHVTTEIASSGALLARNHYNTDFGERTAFFNVSMSKLNPTTRTVTGDRLEFLGRNGSQRRPAALLRTRLSGRVGAGLDPCAAIQLTFDLVEDQTREFVFTLGAGRDTADAEALITRFRGPAAAQDALTTVQQYWQRTLNTVHVKTPDPALNILANGWLLYQTMSCRLWGRSGYYQSGGAFGFRDQLQDVMALTHTEPTLFRAHLLLCAAHQFTEGDVQHWWHPPSNRGLRSRCSDDYLWLPFALCRYIETTGDMTILDEAVNFLNGRALNPEEESYYDLPTQGESASLYQHAVRAIQHGLKFGEHGLPFMGSGDWNDGMNLVGEHGKGESIWLGFFLYSILTQFSVLAKQHGDSEFADRCTTESLTLQKKLEENGWDGEWYRRAYFDDGSPLGSASNTECKIDSIAQSWSVLSSAAKSDRAKQAMSSLNKYLVKKEALLIQLLTPPFDHSALNPGYIKGYVPGVRENGGQYTHAAIWATMAFAQLGENQLAWSLFHILNPINHARTPEEVDIYKIEPYVIAADIYSVAPHIGHGGWSWYTGSAAWMYRLITESLLGLRLNNKKLTLTPCLPDDWDNFSLEYQYGEKTVYHITVNRNAKKLGITLDGIKLDGDFIPLIDDQEIHTVIVNTD